MKKSLSLAEYRKLRNGPPRGAPILMTPKELSRAFRGAVFEPKAFPKGTLGLRIIPLPGGELAGFEMCISDPDVVCWFEPRLGGRCICDERGGVGGIEGGPFPTLGCRWDRLTLRCKGECDVEGHECKRYFSFWGERPAVARARAEIQGVPAVRVLEVAAQVVAASWLDRLHLLVGCVCR
jgi:hypothetical protein